MNTTDWNTNLLSSAAKALECLDKINKSLPDFKRAVIDGDLNLLVSVFGFTKKTAEKLLFAFRGQADGWSVS